MPNTPHKFDRSKLYPPLLIRKTPVAEIAFELRGSKLPKAFKIIAAAVAIAYAADLLIKEKSPAELRAEMKAKAEQMEAFRAAVRKAAKENTFEPGEYELFIKASEALKVYTR